MKVSLIGKENLTSIILPKNIENDYLIRYGEENEDNEIINIKAEKGKWVVESDDYIKVINPEYIKIKDGKLGVSNINACMEKKAILKENSMFPLLIEDLNEIFFLYCSAIYEKCFMHMNIKNSKSLTIGSNDKNDIVYKNDFISSVHAKIEEIKGKWVLENYDTLYGTFVNNIPVYDKHKTLNYGDVIFIMGLKIIIMKDSMYINNPNNMLTLSDWHFSEIKSEKKNKENKPNEKSTENNIKRNKEIKYYSRAPRITKVISEEEFKIDEPPQAQNDFGQRSILLIIGSSLTMGTMMISSLYNAIQGMISGRATIRRYNN